jgi:peptidoglycan/LPS O-acetylase OafA/YrhL
MADPRLAAPTLSGMSEPAASAGRIDSLDGLRGIAIILVVLSHGWIIWPTHAIGRNSFTAALFTSGDSAVSIFLAVSGFLLFRSISATPSRVQMQPVTVAARRVLRVGPTMWLMLAAVMVVAAIDPTDHETKRVNRDSLTHALTFTYNWLVEERLTQTRMDLGHLWYVAVDMQAVVIVSLIAFFLRQRPTALIGTLAGLFVVLVVWRFHSVAVESIWITLNRTTARMDAFVIGALAAAVLPRLPTSPASDRGYRILAMSSLVALVPVFYWAHIDVRYLRWAGTVLELLVAAAMIGLTMAPGRHPVLGRGALAGLGRASLAIYLWHFPIFHFVDRHASDWDWPWRTLLALGATALLAWLTHVTLERSVHRFLARPAWDVIRDGHFGHGIRELVSHRGGRRAPTPAGEQAQPRS